MDARAQLLPLRLHPGDDLRRSLEAIALRDCGGAAFVLSGIGSLHDARLRYADADGATVVAGPVEILTLSGSLGATGAHLHMAVSDAAGRVFGGHVVPGSIVRTTAEVLLAPLADWSLAREHDPATGYDELVARRR